MTNHQNSKTLHNATWHKYVHYEFLNLPFRYIFSGDVTNLAPNQMLPLPNIERVHNSNLPLSAIQPVARFFCSVVLLEELGILGRPSSTSKVRYTSCVEPGTNWNLAPRRSAKKKQHNHA